MKRWLPPPNQILRDGIGKISDQKCIWVCCRYAQKKSPIRPYHCAEEVLQNATHHLSLGHSVLEKPEAIPRPTKRRVEKLYWQPEHSPI